MSKWRTPEQYEADYARIKTPAEYREWYNNQRFVKQTKVDYNKQNCRMWYYRNREVILFARKLGVGMKEGRALYAATERVERRSPRGKALGSDDKHQP